MEIMREVSRWGNGAGILLPREWMGNQVKVILIDRTLEIKKEVFNILEPYLDDIVGIYLVGSYARGEETADSDIDILVLSNKIKKELISSKYNVSIIPLESLRKTLHGDYPELVLPRLLEARVILNKRLLEELKNINLKKNAFREFFKDTKRIININREIIKKEEQNSNLTKSASLAYSVILRLRGLFLIKCILNKTKYTSKAFENWVTQGIDKSSFTEIYQAYVNFKNKKKPSIQLKIVDLSKLIHFLEKQLEND